MEYTKLDCSNIVVIISVLYMHYKVFNDGFTLLSLLNLSKYLKVCIPALFLTMHLIFS